MDPEDEWNLIRKDRGWRIDGTSMGLVRIALLFGFVAAAFALILVPIADEQSRAYSARATYGDGIDNFKTGTIRRRDTYTIRRSVLQPSTNSICVIRDGQRRGDC
jgi:lipopolysaccharide export LptBFGC system permease protein LptF